VTGRARAGALIAAGLLCSALAGPVAAQEATSTPAATQPSVGKWYLRQLVELIDKGVFPADDGSVDGDGSQGDMLVVDTVLARGLLRNLSASLAVPVIWPRKGDTGVGDLALAVKWRPYQRDLGPVDSVRFAIYGGVEIPSGDSAASSRSWDPFAGGVLTAILGRHGFNQSLAFKRNNGTDAVPLRVGDGPADALRYDTAYLFRIDPPAYTADTRAATYLTLELGGLYETSGDNEILLGPGLLYEARTYALEATVRWPVVQDLRRRANTDLVVTLGYRLLF
jgi:hypothetical protein